MGRAIKGAILVLLLAIIGVLGFIVIKTGALTGSVNKKAEEPKEGIYSMGEFTVNLDEPGYRKYMKVTISLGYTMKGTDISLEENKTKISDVITGILRSKKLEDVNTAAKTDAVKNEIKEKINGILKVTEITNVYFEQILIQ